MAGRTSGRCHRAAGTKLTATTSFPHAEIEAAGYRALVRPEDLQRRGAAQPQPSVEVVRNIPGLRRRAGARDRRPLAVRLRVIGAYAPNGQAPDSDKFSYKMRWLDALRAWVAQELAAHPQLVLMGDFNIAPQDRDVHDPAWAGQIHCTPRPNASTSAACRAGLHDAFRLFEQPPKSWSWWDYATSRSARTRACASTTSSSATR